ncbi:MAG: hypothetical protein ACFE85_16230 [Candidatus Hodarchaeota archaeon]
MKLNFKPGKNIAIKVPIEKYEATVKFYSDIIGLPLKLKKSNSVMFKFGEINLWIDRMEKVEKTEVWFEIQTDNTEEAKNYFQLTNIERKDEIEELPLEFDGFWISNPAGVIHLITNEEDEI